MSDQSPYQPPYPQSGPYVPYASLHAPPMPYSGIGLASFIIGILIGIFELAMLVLAAVLAQQKTSSSSPVMEVAGCGMLLGLAVNLIGVILGIIGVRQADRKKVFAILGLCINAMTLLGVAGLILVGLAIK
jgi:hypothetical protein